jgi:alcohol dehydrogenase YqhD (iron-dependent ADH family)
MLNFTFQNATKIIFGKGTENDVGEEAKKYSNKCLLVTYDNGIVEGMGLFDRALNSLKKAGVETFVLKGVVANAKLDLVYKGIQMCRENNIGFLLAMGGGSVIDTCKSIGVGVNYKGDIWDFYAEKVFPTESLPVGVILTIPAAGSETSEAAVITRIDTHEKRAIHGDVIRPKFAIMNPELLYTLPKYQIAAGVTDILAHDMERYFCNVPHIDLSDRLCEGIFKAVKLNGEVVVKDPTNYDSWSEVMWGGTLAHNDITTCGRVQDLGSHEIAHQLSALYDATHGATLSVIFPAWMKYNYKTNIPRFAQFATNMMNVDYLYRDPEATVLEGIQKLEDFYTSIGMPTRLSGLGITDDRFEEMALQATLNEKIKLGNFVKLGKEDIINIYKLAV